MDIERTSLTDLDNLQLIKTRQEVVKVAREMIKALKDLVKLDTQLKAELQVRMSALEIELSLAEMNRKNSEIPYFDNLLDFH